VSPDVRAFIVQQIETALAFLSGERDRERDWELRIMTVQGLAAAMEMLRSSKQPQQRSDDQCQ
jgi:hypothetical protein